MPPMKDGYTSIPATGGCTDARWSECGRVDASTCPLSRREIGGYLVKKPLSLYSNSQRVATAPVWTSTSSTSPDALKTTPPMRTRSRMTKTSPVIRPVSRELWNSIATRKEVGNAARANDA